MTNRFTLGDKMLKERYFFGNESTYEDLVDRMLSVLPDGQEERKEILKEAFLERIIVPATPNLTNLGTSNPDKGGKSRGLPISCFVSEFDDNIENIISTLAHNSILSAYGGGVGTDISSVREIGAKISDNGKTGGIFPFLNIQASNSLGISQGGTRGGAAVVNIDIDHPEIEEFIKFRLVEEGSAKDRKFPRLNHTVKISDKFMEAVLTDSDFDLISRVDGSVVKTVKAFDLFMDLLDVRYRRGEPNIIFSDNTKKNRSTIYDKLNKKSDNSNLCFTGDSVLHTSLGRKTFKELYDTQQEFEVAVDSRTHDLGSKVGAFASEFKGDHNEYDLEITNGDFLLDATVLSKKSTKVVLTAKDQEIYRLTTSNGIVVDCTAYHKWPVIRDDKRLMKIPLKEINTETDHLLLQSGEGLFPVEDDHRDRGEGECNKLFAGVYSRKQSIELIESVFVKYGRIILDSHGEQVGIELVFDNTRDADYVFEISDVLQNFGIPSTISENDHWDTPCFSIEIHRNYALKFVRLFGGSIKEGTHLYEVIKDTPVDNNVDHTVGILSIEYVGRQDVYDVCQPESNSIIVNGLVTGNCVEVLLETSPDMTSVCCLGSLNLEHWDKIENNTPLIEAFMYFLDCSLQETVRQIRMIEDPVARLSMERVVKFIETDHSIGLGVMGYHTHLQIENIPLESALAVSRTHSIFSNIKKMVDEANYNLGVELGSCKLAKEAGVVARFSNCTAIAPTASISYVAGGVSPGIDPILSNYYSIGNEEGYTSWRNPTLGEKIKTYANEMYEQGKVEVLDTWIEHQWQSILRNEGSVQHLEWMDQWDKDVFKTAYEIEQDWIVELAAVRQLYIDQSQSTNLFFPSDIHVRKLFNTHVKAWHQGLKTLYYCRTKAASRASDSGEDVRINTIESNDKEETFDFNECLACQ